MADVGYLSCRSGKAPLTDSRNPTPRVRALQYGRRRRRRPWPVFLSCHGPDSALRFWLIWHPAILPFILPIKGTCPYRAATVPASTPAAPASSSASQPPEVPPPPGNFDADMAEEEFDRSLPIFCIETGKTYPAPDKFDDKSPLRYERENLKLWGSAPWLDRDAIDIDWLMERYVDHNDVLPGGIPINALNSFSWRNQYSVSDTDLHVPSGRKLSGIRAEFAYAVYEGLEKLNS